VKVFDLELGDDIIRAIAEHGERDYPDEACGLVLGAPDRGELERVAPMKNVQNKYHERDPQQFPRTAKDAFRLDELERMKLLDGAGSSVERILYHSHCDAGAYFSPEDRAAAIHQGSELMPGVVHVVVSVREGKARDMAAFKWDGAKQLFREVRIKIDPGAPALPDLELRAMEGGEAARPIRPVGGKLGLRRLGSIESETLRTLPEGRRIALESKEQAEDLRCFERGFFSPLTGFMRSADVFSIDFKGRTQKGTPWRTPLRLELAKKAVPAVAAGAVVELASLEGEPMALMAVVSIEVVKDRVFLGGPVYVYPSEGLDAAELRASILRLGAKQILALGKSVFAKAQKANLSAFDVVLAEGQVGDRTTLPYEGSHRGDWLAAAAAQNSGATHVWVEDQSLAKQIEDTLEIKPWQPE
jgi:[CysO sulfur-carrier protein]-S-L-cysteine hydrolase